MSLAWAFGFLTRKRTVKKNNDAKKRVNIFLSLLLIPKYVVDKQNRDMGKPKVGGPFSLVDCETKERVTDKSFLGKFIVIYFGFTNCPDVCPDELEKMSHAIRKMDKMPGVGEMVTPVFVSVDPGRDTPEAVKEYIKEFHPRFVGLVGTEEEIQKAAKAYRIYVSKGILSVGLRLFMF